MICLYHTSYFAFSFLVFEDYINIFRYFSFVELVVHFMLLSRFKFSTICVDCMYMRFLGPLCTMLVRTREGDFLVHHKGVEMFQVLYMCILLNILIILATLLILVHVHI